MNWVKQKHPRGCGIAALAMVTGEDYDVIADYFGDCFETHGLYLHQLDLFLFDRGYSIQRRWPYRQRRNEQIKTTPWPPLLFAPVHIAQVLVFKDSPCSHLVVMREDGTVLDPEDSRPLKLSTYCEVQNVTGIRRWRWRQRKK